jgi:alkylation response protein AidB-like acyl-CoA dehydrogenase
MGQTEDRAWRAEVRDFLLADLPPALRETVRAGQHVTRDALANWQNTLRRRGWLVPHWAPEWGGCAWTPMQRHIFEDEYASAYGPALHTFNLSMIGPILLRFGTPAQQQEHLPRYPG